ncbi:restriction endonuclease [Halorubrum vacuolatum]|uniref:Restriction endonuclease n=1 Tax=Halorubrum vacuolatum TaxID=63740 RepID=A0A238YBK2_HALVU|nr:Restriction endonuclease [Halorubrum vacuolatum]
MECCQQTTTAAAHLWERSDLDALDWREFEQLVAMLYESRGCDTRLTDDGADGGVDIYVRCSGRLKAVEVKHRTSGGTVGRPVVQKTASHLLRQPVLQAVVVSSGQFSSDALSYVAGTDANITLVSGKDVLAAASINGLPKGGNS